MKELILIVVVFLALSVLVIRIRDLPPILLPKAMQHNNIGELPFVEAMDDGDFYEEDGAEDITPQNCNRIIRERCQKEESGMSVAGCYLSMVGTCDALQKQQLIAEAIAGNPTAKAMVEMGWY